MLHQRVKGGRRGGGEDNEAPVSIMQRPAEVVVSQRAGARRPGSSSWRDNLLEWGDLGQVLCPLCLICYNSNVEGILLLPPGTGVKLINELISQPEPSQTSFRFSKARSLISHLCV